MSTQFTVPFNNTNSNSYVTGPILSPQLSSSFSLSSSSLSSSPGPDLQIQHPDLLPTISKTSYSAISVDNVDRLREIIKNLRCKRHDGINIVTNKSKSNTFFVCHTPNLQFGKYQNDDIYKYNSYFQLKKSTEHKTNKTSSYEMRWIPKVLSANNIMKNDIISMPWSYYRDITIKKNRNNNIINNKPDGTYFICAQLIKNNIHQSDSFINHLNILEKDELIKYDIKDYKTARYLHHKSNEFGKQDLLHKYNVVGTASGRITPPRYYAPNDPDDSDSDNGITPRIPDLYDLRSNESNISLFNIPSPMNRSLYTLRSQSVLSVASLTNNNSSCSSTQSQSSQSQTRTPVYRNNGSKYKSMYDDNNKCILYKCVDDDGNELDIINKNTSFVHHIIDPNKNINDHHLWIPSIFNCNNNNTGFGGLIQSQIVGLDYVKYKLLYDDIGNIFNKMRTMFENILNRKLGSSEKVIVSINKHILQKYGDEYEEMQHKCGMGENIECIGLYVPQIYNKKYINLQLSFNKNNKYIKNTINLSEGDCIVFSNEIDHNIQRIVHTNNNDIDNDNKAIYYTILSFYLINKNEKHLYCSNSNKLYVNLIYNWSYCISYWLRNYCKNINIIQNMSNSWMNGLIYLYLFGMDYDEYIYDRRQNMVQEKQKSIMKHESVNIAVHLQAFLYEMNINQ